MSEVHLSIGLVQQWFTDFTQKHLRRDLVQVIPALADEVNLAITDIWGQDTENWREVAVFETFTTVAARAINRVAVGKPLCR
jgi:hypothetical protein